MTYKEAKTADPYILFRKSKMIRYYGSAPESEQEGDDWNIMTKSQEQIYWMSFMLPEIEDRLKRGVYPSDIAKDVEYLIYLLEED